MHVNRSEKIATNYADKTKIQTMVAGFLIFHNRAN